MYKWTRYWQHFWELGEREMQNSKEIIAIEVFLSATICMCFFNLIWVLTLFYISSRLKLSRCPSYTHHSTSLRICDDVDCEHFPCFSQSISDAPGSCKHWQDLQLWLLSRWTDDSCNCPQDCSLEVGVNAAKVTQVNFLKLDQLLCQHVDGWEGRCKAQAPQGQLSDGWGDALKELDAVLPGDFQHEGESELPKSLQPPHGENLLQHPHSAPCPDEHKKMQVQSRPHARLLPHLPPAPLNFL